MGISQPHILVTGSPRSGTTWVGHTISQHHQVNYIQEPFSVSYPNRGVGLKLNTWFTHYPSSNQKAEIKASFDSLLWSSPVQRAVRSCMQAGLDLKTPLRLGKHIALNYRYPTRFLIKDPIALLSAGWLYETYQLRVLCIIRNPLAFVGSLKKAGWDFDFKNLQQQEELMQSFLSPFSHDIEKLCSFQGDFVDRACLLWNILHYAILEYQKQYPDWLFLKYEDIAEDPLSKFEGVFEYLQLDLGSHIRAYIQSYTSQDNPTDSKSNLYQPRNSKTSLTSWSKRLSVAEVDRISRTTKDIAAQFYPELAQSF